MYGFMLLGGLNYSQPVIYYRVGMQPAEVSEEKSPEIPYQYADSLNLLSEEREGRVKNSIVLWMIN